MRRGRLVYGFAFLLYPAICSWDLISRFCLFFAQQCFATQIFIYFAKSRLTNSAYKGPYIFLHLFLVLLLGKRGKACASRISGDAHDIMRTRGRLLQILWGKPRVKGLKTSTLGAVIAVRKRKSKTIMQALRQWGRASGMRCPRLPILGSDS